jgi:3-isopropylmalate dehydrogenase
MATRSLFLLPGDGIGPEAMAEVRKIIAHMNDKEAAGFATDEGLVGGSAYDAHGQAISDADMEKAHGRRRGAVRRRRRSEVGCRPL